MPEFSKNAKPRSMVMPRRFSSSRRSGCVPVKASTSEDLRWSMWPAVPTMTLFTGLDMKSSEQLLNAKRTVQNGQIAEGGQLFCGGDFFNDRLGRGAGIACRNNGTSDDHIVGAGFDGLSWSSGARLFVLSLFPRSFRG